MMTFGMDLATGPDSGGMAIRTPTGWHLVPMEPLADLLALWYRPPEHQAVVEAALQDLVRAHADRQGPCVTAEEANDPAVRMRALLGARQRWAAASFDGWFRWRFPRPPLPSERMAAAMGLGPSGYCVPRALVPKLPKDCFNAGCGLEVKKS